MKRPEAKAKQREYIRRPENIAKSKARQATPEYKASKKILEMNNDADLIKSDLK